MKGILLAVFTILFVSVSLYYQFYWYSFAEYIHMLSAVFGLFLFIFTAVVVKGSSKNIVYFFGTLSLFGFILMIAFYSLVNVEIYNLKTHTTEYYFKKDNLKGAYIYNPDNICYKFAYNNRSQLVFVRALKKLQFVSFNSNLKFERYFEFRYKNINLSDIDNKVDIYIKECN